MADTTFTNGVTLTDAAWFQDLNNLRYGADNTARGAALLQFIDSGTGAVTRTQQAKSREIVSIADYATGDGTDESAAIQKFFNAAVGRLGIITEPPTAWGLGSTGIVLAAGRYDIKGAGRDTCNFTYSGTGIAFDGTTNAGVGGVFEDFSITCSNDAATGMSFGNGTQSIRVVGCALWGNATATNTGTGILLDANCTANQFSGQAQLDMNDVRSFKYGLRATGGASARTWTTISGSNNYFIGRAAGIISGSRGILFETSTNGVGSGFNGGTIEAYAVPIEIVSPSYGIDYLGDMEGNTTNTPVIAATANVIILNRADGRLYQQSANGTSNVWYRQLDDLGEHYLETHSGQYSVVYDASGSPAEWLYYRRTDSLIGSGGELEGLVHGVRGGASFATPEATYRLFGEQKESWASAAPTGGSWKQGDVIWNTGVAAGGSPGWMCVTTGTFGTATDSTGDTDGSTNVITGMTDTSDFNIGDFVNVSAGFASLTGLLILAKTATTITVSRDSNGAASNITVDTSDPVFKAMANVAA